MSRSRRPHKNFGKCAGRGGCGRKYHIWIGEHNKKHGKVQAGCPILEYMDRDNEMFLKFRERRKRVIEED